MMLAQLFVQQEVWTVLAAALPGIACALLGVFLLLKRQSMLGDAITHGVLPGIVAGFALSHELDSWMIFFGAMLFGLLTALAAELLQRSGLVHADTALGITFSTLFALGIILISSHYRGTDLDTDCVLLGHLESVPVRTVPMFGWHVPRAIPQMLVIVLLVIGFVVIFWKELKLTTFDPQLADAMGYRPWWLHLALTTLVAGSTVAALEAVGLVLVVALLVAPAATAFLLTTRLAIMLVLAPVFAVASAFLGYRAAVFSTQTVSVAGMVAVVAGVLFLLALLLAPRQGLLARGIRRARLALRMAREEILAGLYRAEESGAHRLAPSPDVHGLPRWVTLWARRSLRQHGDIETSPRGDRLTPQGRQAAEFIVRSHRLWESYVGREMALPPDHVHAPAALMEHFIGPEVQRDLAEKLDQPSQDPHGRRIPGEGR